MGTGRNWSRKHHADGVEFINNKLDIIHKQIESSHSPQGIQFMHCIDGETG